jgi:RNA polymerase sigma-70 factor (sigma-E family)
VTEATIRRVAGAVETESTYDVLFRAHFRRMVQLATLLGADDAEDVAQEAFARLHRSASRLRDYGAALAYLRVTVCNLSHSRIRHLIVARRHASRLLSPEQSSTEQTAVLREEHREVLAALESLPRRPREVLVLRYWHDLTEADIADTLGITTGAVKSYASRGLAAIEKTLGSSS